MILVQLFRRATQYRPYKCILECGKSIHIYCLTKETLQPKSMSFYSRQKYCEIMLKVSCFDGISNVLQRGHQIGNNQCQNLTSLLPSFSSYFQTTWTHGKLKRELDIHGNKEINYPDILPQEQLPKQLSLSCNSRVKIDVNVYNNTTTNGNNS